MNNTQMDRELDTAAIASLEVEKYLGILVAEASAIVTTRDLRPFDIGSLPISAGLRQRLDTWITGFGMNIVVNIDDDPNFSDHYAEAYRIACALKEELPDWIIGYDDPRVDSSLRGDEMFAQMQVSGFLRLPAKEVSGDGAMGFHATHDPKTDADWDAYQIQYRAFIAHSKFVKMLGEHSESPLWDIEGVELELDGIDLADHLKDRLLKWNQWHSALETLLQDHNSAPPTDYWKDCAEAGLRLACEIKEQLPGWKVIYGDSHMWSVDPKANWVEVV